MNQKSKQKCVLITGCSSGIGAALARECHAQGYQVVATARRPESLKTLESLGIECLKLDVNSPQDITALVSYFKNRSQTIDFIINNAGIGLMAPMSDLDVETLHQQFQTNVYAIVNITNALVPLLVAQKHGCIINIGSVSGILTTPFAGAYCASKAAVHAISEAYRMELAPFGIDVCIVQPGAIQSSFGSNATATTEQLLKADSLFAPIEAAVRKRANASQENPSSAEDFAKVLVKHMATGKPPAVMRIGNGSTLLPLLPRILPPRLLDKALGKPFKLDKLKR